MNLIPMLALTNLLLFSIHDTPHYIFINLFTRA
jgi:hypothetical protein